jgi:sugar (pentulose or hexulose) kinase
MDVLTQIEKGETYLGIELGSTTIKSVLNDTAHHPIEEGSFSWESRHENGIWTYNLSDAISGMQQSYADLKSRIKSHYNITLTGCRAIGISGMMHGYLVFGKNGNLLTPYRTWRNTITKEASSVLTQLFNYNIPQRWSIAHLYQSILRSEPHVADISFMTTLSGYVHWCLTGKKVLGIGDASGMFPIDLTEKTYDAAMIRAFDALIAEHAYPWRLRDILPDVLLGGKDAGTLTESGAKLLDPSGDLKPGILFCPPEGDTSTGMIATNALYPRTGNISAGTSDFAMLTLEHSLSRVYTQIDLNATPSGHLAANVHCNHCTSDLNEWVHIFGQFAKAAGLEMASNQLYSLLFRLALNGDNDCGGLLAYNFYSGEPIVGLDDGRPLLTRSMNSHFTLENLMRANLFTAFAGLKSGMEILQKDEHMAFDRIMAHGGIFKTPHVAQSILAAAMDTPISVTTTAAYGGAWGIAVLAAYTYALKHHETDKTLDGWVDQDVFVKQKMITENPDPAMVSGFNSFYQRYINGLPIEKAAAECIN